MIDRNKKVNTLRFLIHGSILLTIFSIFFLGQLFAQSPETLFESANQAYASSDYQEAINLYQKILQQGVESGEVFFNLGNAYYKQNAIGQSILYYEKARKYLEGDPGLEQNLKLAKLKIIDKIDELPRLFVDEWWHELNHLFSINIFLWGTFLFFAIFITFIIMQILFERRVLRNFIWISFSIFSFLLILTIGRIYEFETSKFGVILEEKVSVVSEPDLDGTEVFILHEGTKVRINREREKWLEITIPDGKAGWLKSSDLGLI